MTNDPSESLFLIDRVPVIPVARCTTSPTRAGRRSARRGRSAGDRADAAHPRGAGGIEQIAPTCRRPGRRRHDCRARAGQGRRLRGASSWSPRVRRTRWPRPCRRPACRTFPGATVSEVPQLSGPATGAQVLPGRGLSAGRLPEVHRRPHPPRSRLRHTGWYDEGQRRVPSLAAEPVCRVGSPWLHTADAPGGQQHWVRITWLARLRRRSGPVWARPRAEHSAHGRREPFRVERPSPGCRPSQAWPTCVAPTTRASGGEEDDQVSPQSRGAVPRVEGRRWVRPSPASWTSHQEHGISQFSGACESSTAS